MTLQRNHYEVIGVPRKATTDEIKKKYRELARKFHPDIAQDKAMGEKIFSQINQAYHILGDPDKRAQYDAVLAADASERTPAPSRNGADKAPASGNGLGAFQPQTEQNAANVTRLLDEAEKAMLQNNVGKVKAICDKVMETDPRNLKALSLLGDALAQMGRPQEAAAAYRQALQIAPNLVLQAKLNRLQGVATNGNGAQSPPKNGAVPRMPPAPPTNGTGQAGQRKTDQGRAEKSGGGLLSRLLGRK